MTYQKGAANPQWKGDAASYKAFHLRVATVRGKPKHCEHCGTTNPEKRYEWASISQNYADVYDYKRLCRRCHMRFDGLDLQLAKYNKAREKPKPEKKTFKEKQCVGCTVKFLPVHWRQKFCNRKCLGSSWHRAKRRKLRLLKAVV